MSGHRVGEREVDEEENHARLVGYSKGLAFDAAHVMGWFQAFHI